MNMLTTAPLTMSSREIAELCDKRHDNVMADIKKMLEDLGFDALTFQDIYKDARNRDQIEYRLPKDLTVTLITGYRADLRYKVVKRLEELEAAARAPALPDLSDPVLLVQLLTEHASKRIEAEARVLTLEHRVADMADDVAAHERLTKADGSLNVTEAAKNLGIRPKDLFDWLSHNGWIYKRVNGPNWLGFQTKCNQGLLEHKTTTVLRSDGSEKITEQVRVTAKGLTVLAKLIQPTARLIA